MTYDEPQLAELSTEETDERDLSDLLSALQGNHRRDTSTLSPKTLPDSH